jgi:hypothetical protein
MNSKIRPQRTELRLAAQTAGADPGVSPQLLDGGIPEGTQSIARILALGNGCNFESLGEIRGQIFQTMDTEVDLSGFECLLDLFSEHAFRANLRKRDIEDFVTGGMKNPDFDLVAPAAQLFGNVIGLPQGQL